MCLGMIKTQKLWNDTLSLYGRIVINFLNLDLDDQLIYQLRQKVRIMRYDYVNVQYHLSIRLP